MKLATHFRLSAPKRFNFLAPLRSNYGLLLMGCHNHQTRIFLNFEVNKSDFVSKLNPDVTCTSRTARQHSPWATAVR